MSEGSSSDEGDSWKTDSESSSGGDDLNGNSTAAVEIKYNTMDKKYVGKVNVTEKEGGDIESSVVNMEQVRVLDAEKDSIGFSSSGSEWYTDEDDYPNKNNTSINKRNEGNVNLIKVNEHTPKDGVDHEKTMPITISKDMENNKHVYTKKTSSEDEWATDEEGNKLDMEDGFVTDEDEHLLEENHDNNSNDENVNNIIVKDIVHNNTNGEKSSETTESNEDNQNTKENTQSNKNIFVFKHDVKRHDNNTDGHDLDIEHMATVNLEFNDSGIEFYTCHEEGKIVKGIAQEITYNDILQWSTDEDNNTFLLFTDREKHIFHGSKIKLIEPLLLLLIEDTKHVDIEFSDTSDGEEDENGNLFSSSISSTSEDDSDGEEDENGNLFSSSISSTSEDDDENDNESVIDHYKSIIANMSKKLATVNNEVKNMSNEIKLYKNKIETLNDRLQFLQIARQEMEETFLNERKEFEETIQMEKDKNTKEIENRVIALKKDHEITLNELQGEIHLEIERRKKSIENMSKEHLERINGMEKLHLQHVQNLNRDVLIKETINEIINQLVDSEIKTNHLAQENLAKWRNFAKCFAKNKQRSILSNLKAYIYNLKCKKEEQLIAENNLYKENLNALHEETIKDVMDRIVDQIVKPKIDNKRLKRSLNKRKRNEAISLSVRRKPCELRFDEDGEEQTLGNYIMDENDQLQWSPPFGSSYDNLFYCHDPDCRRRFTSARSLNIHIFSVGNKYRQNIQKENVQKWRKIAKQIKKVKQRSIISRLKLYSYNLKCKKEEQLTVENIAYKKEIVALKARVKQMEKEEVEIEAEVEVEEKKNSNDDANLKKREAMENNRNTNYKKRVILM